MKDRDLHGKRPNDGTSTSEIECSKIKIKNCNQFR